MASQREPRQSVDISSLLRVLGDEPRLSVAVTNLLGGDVAPSLRKPRVELKRENLKKK